MRLDEPIEARGFDGDVEFGQQAAHQAEADGADDLLVLFRGLAERAVV